MQAEQAAFNRRLAEESHSDGGVDGKRGMHMRSAGARPAATVPGLAAALFGHHVTIK